MKRYFWGIFLMLFFWELLSLVLDRVFLPSPLSVLIKLGELIQTPELFLDVWSTLKRVVIGLCLGTLFGLNLGTILGLFPKLYRLLRLPIDFIRSIPATALFPLFIVLFGLGESVKIFVAAWATSFIIFINTFYGLQNVSNTRRLMGKLKKFSLWQNIFYIYIPSALPYIAAGLRVSLSFSLIIELVAEMFLGSQSGLGHRIFAASSILDMEEVYASIVLVGMLGYSLNSLMLMIEKRFIHWSPQGIK